jgi:tetratricopeptide (TPR) repeat protein
MKRRNLYILITIVITSCLHIACAKDGATQNLSPGPSAEQISAARASSEQLFAQRTDLTKLREAIKTVGAVRDPNKRDYDVEWTFARYNYFLGRHAEDETEAEKAFTQGKDAAKIAANVNPNRPEGHFWYGANLGELCKRSPVTVGIRNVDDVREAMKKVIAIDPGYQGASAYDVLGQIELATRIKDGTAEKAVEYLEKALELEKENSNIYVHLAEAYLAVNKDAEAKKHLDHVIKMKPNPEYLPEHNESVEDAKKLLAKKFS